jgi:NitT/TauT family transport system substrate-binding protein
VIRKFSIYLTIIALCLWLPSFGQNQEFKKIRFVPGWFSQAQFAGYYVAKEKGFYRDAGLDVEILSGGPEYLPDEMLASGQADIGLMFLIAAVTAKGSGTDMVNVAQFVQRSAIMFVAKKESGIKTPQDFNGKKIGVWRSDFQELSLAFLDKYNIKAEIIPVTSTINLFLKGGVDVMNMMWYNEYHRALNAGFNPDELQTFHFADYGLNFPEDGLYVLRSKYESDPGTYRAFVNASIKGWIYAFAHKEEAIDMTIAEMKMNKILSNRAYQRWMLNRMENLFSKDPDYGIDILLKDEDFRNTTELLYKAGKITRIPDYHSFQIIK